MKLSKRNPDKNIFPTGINMVFKLGMDGNFTFLSPALADFLKVKPLELVGKPFESIVRRDYRGRVVNFYRHQIEIKLASAYTEFPLQTKLSRELWVGQTSEAIFEEGKIVEFVVVMTDISERVMAHRLARNSEEKYRNIIENINLGLMEVDLEDVIIYVNQSFCNITGYDFEELVGRSAGDILLENKDTRVKLTMQDTDKKGSFAYEVGLRRKNGNTAWTIVSEAPVHNSREEIIGSLTIHNDITRRKEQEIQRINLLNELEIRNRELQEKQEYLTSAIHKLKQAEKALRESERRQRKLIESAMDGIITIDGNGIVTEWNPQATELFGFKQNEAIGALLSELIIPEKFRSQHQAGLAHFLETGERNVLNKRIEIFGQRKSKEYFPVELSIVPMKVNGKYFFSAFVRDITLKKNAEEDLRRALEQQKELNQMKSRLVSMTSHEFRTPLTTIRTNMDLLSFTLEKEGLAGNEKITRSTRRIESELKRLTSLMNDILVIGTLESGQMPFKPRLTNFPEYIRQVIGRHFSEPDKEDGIKVHISGKPRKVMIDGKVYQHIITNLLSNAFKYSEGKPAPEVLIRFDPDAMQFSVRDYGIGIPKAEQYKLFDSFYRASNSEKIQGTGLGLSIVSQFVKMHNATINFESKLNKGSTFTITHPYIVTKPQKD